MLNIYARNDYVKMVLRIQKLRVNTPPLKGQLNSDQLMCHLADYLRYIFGETPADDHRDFFKTTILKYYVLYGSWIVSKSLIPIADYWIPEHLKAQPTTFENDRHILLSMLQKFFGLNDEFVFPPHPVYGNLTPAQWGRITWLYFNYHLKQFGVY